MDAGPLNLSRPEVPAELAAVVAKMMAKEPGRRFQTPGEVAQALTPFFKPAASHRSRSKPEISPVGTAGGCNRRQASGGLGTDAGQPRQIGADAGTRGQEARGPDATGFDLGGSDRSPRDEISYSTRCWTGSLQPPPRS